MRQASGPRRIGRATSTLAWEFPGSENMLCAIYGLNPELLLVSNQLLHVFVRH